MEFPAVKIIANNSLSDTQNLLSTLASYNIKVTNAITDFKTHLTQNKECLIGFEYIGNTNLWKLSELENGMCLNLFHNLIVKSTHVLNLGPKLNWGPEWRIDTTWDLKDWVTFPYEKSFTIDECKVVTESIHELWKIDNWLLEIYNQALIPVFQHPMIQKMLNDYKIRKSLHLQMWVDIRDSLKLPMLNKYIDKIIWEVPKSLASLLYFIIQAIKNEEWGGKEAIHCLKTLNNNGKFISLISFIEKRNQEKTIQTKVMQLLLDTLLELYPFLDQELAIQLKSNNSFANDLNTKFLESLRGLKVSGLSLLPSFIMETLYSSNDSLNESDDISETLSESESESESVIIENFNHTTQKFNFIQNKSTLPQIKNLIEKSSDCVLRAKSRYMETKQIKILDDPSKDLIKKRCRDWINERKELEKEKPRLSIMPKIEITKKNIINSKLKLKNKIPKRLTTDKFKKKSRELAKKLAKELAKEQPTKLLKKKPKKKARELAKKLAKELAKEKSKIFKEKSKIFKEKSKIFKEKSKTIKTKKKSKKLLKTETVYKVPSQSKVLDNLFTDLSIYIPKNLPYKKRKIIDTDLIKNSNLEFANIKESFVNLHTLDMNNLNSCSQICVNDIKSQTCNKLQNSKKNELKPHVNKFNVYPKIPKQLIEMYKNFKFNDSKLNLNNTTTLNDSDQNDITDSDQDDIIIDRNYISDSDQDYNNETENFTSETEQYNNQDERYIDNEQNINNEQDDDIEDIKNEQDDDIEDINNEQYDDIEDINNKQDDDIKDINNKQDDDIKDINNKQDDIKDINNKQDDIKDINNKQDDDIKDINNKQDDIKDINNKQDDIKDINNEQDDNQKKQNIKQDNDEQDVKQNIKQDEQTIKQDDKKDFNNTQNKIVTMFRQTINEITQDDKVQNNKFKKTKVKILKKPLSKKMIKNKQMPNKLTCEIHCNLKSKSKMESTNSNMESTSLNITKSNIKSTNINTLTKSIDSDVLESDKLNSDTNISDSFLNLHPQNVLCPCPICYECVKTNI